ncbi:MAG: hypothetical protein GY926_22305 [bacterium]|nr:hypothetical protein [bacterium]
MVKQCDVSHERPSRIAGHEIGDYINDNSPFGPISSEEITDRQLWEQLFDRENQVYTNLRSRDPAFVIGRRGAGKTAFLYALTADEPTLNVKINTSTAVAEVADLLRELDALELTLFTDHIAEIWNAALWHSVFAALILRPYESIGRDSNDFEAVRFYLEDLVDAEDIPSETTILADFCHEFLNQAKAKPIVVRNPLRFDVKGTSLSKAINHANSLFDSASVRPVLLMDSMEDFQDVLNRHAKTFEGLFMHVGRSGHPTAPYRIRFSLPAELLNRLRSMSGNPLKDFGKRIFLNWSAGEITQIAAYRLSIYLRESHPEHLESIPKLASIRSFTRDDSFELLRSALPQSVSGELGVAEDTIAYVLRHTQLLPRHLLRMLNAIWVSNLARGDSPFQVTEVAVVEGISAIESEIVAEVFKAFELVHPLAEEACGAIIRHLPRRFSDADLHIAYNRHGKAALQRGYQERLAANPSAALTIDSDISNMSYFDFRSMLGEVGCIGRVIHEKETERYCVAHFEYALPGRVHLGDDDEFCLHPLFSGVFQAKGSSEGDSKVIYPYGSDPTEDHRATSPRLA